MAGWLQKMKLAINGLVWRQTDQYEAPATDAAFKTIIDDLALCDYMVVVETEAGAVLGYIVRSEESSVGGSSRAKQHNFVLRIDAVTPVDLIAPSDVFTFRYGKKFEKVKLEGASTDLSVQGKIKQVEVYRLGLRAD